MKLQQWMEIQRELFNKYNLDKDIKKLQQVAEIIGKYKKLSKKQVDLVFLEGKLRESEINIFF